MTTPDYLDYHTAQQYSFCAERVTRAFCKTPGIEPLFDEFYWRNVDMLGRVEKNPTDALLLQLACERAGVQITRRDELLMAARDYQTMLVNKGLGFEQKNGMKCMEEELHDVFSEIMGIGAQISRDIRSKESR